MNIKTLTTINNYYNQYCDIRKKHLCTHMISINPIAVNPAKHI